MCNQRKSNSFVITLEASGRFLLCNKHGTRELSLVKHDVVKGQYECDREASFNLNVKN